MAEPKSAKRVTFNVLDDQLTVESCSEIERDTVWHQAVPISQSAPARTSATTSYYHFKYYYYYYY